MEKSPFNQATIILTLVLAIPQTIFYIVGAVSNINSYVESDSWYILSTNAVGVGNFKLKLGLQGLHAQSDAIGYSEFIKYQISDDDDTYYSTQNPCVEPGFAAAAVSSIAALISVGLIAVAIVRIVQAKDSYPNRFLSLFIASVTFILGMGAYGHFAATCGFSYRNDLESSPIYQDIIGFPGPGGACVITAFVFGLIIAIMNVLEIFGSYYGCLGAKPEDSSMASKANV